MLLLKYIFLGVCGFADPNSTAPLLCLVNKTSLDRILQSEVYVNEADGQLRAAHLILAYKPISRAFQALRCVIRAKDPRLHRISVAYEGFVVPKGVPLPINTPFTQPLPIATLSARVPSPSSILHVEEKEEEQQKEEGFVDLTESTDEFEVFNQLSPPKNLSDEMGIQRKPQRSLQELLESQPGRGEPGKSAQPKLPPPPPRSSPRAPQPNLLSRTEQVDPKKRREQKGKDIMETRRPRPTSEEEAHRAAKQQKVSHAPSQGVEKADN